MPALFLYLLKVSISLAIVFLFYRFALRKLTFYNSNRLYLLGYTVLCFFIPFINISPVLERNSWNSNTIVQWVPLIDHTATVKETENILSPAGSGNLTPWNIFTILLIAGIVVMFFRLLVQLISYRKMRSKAAYISGEGTKIFRVNEKIIPFSFGNAIFINPDLHSEAELQEIIRHEFVHVKQRHTIDILWAELLCLLNWYNPFAWMLRASIRQNLEFVADHKVLETGFNKKEYQYLLLKVIGNHQFSIASPFNFSSLKKRIAMMNKTKSAKRQLLRMLFLLPATAVLLLSFRNNWKSPSIKKDNEKKIIIAGLVVDASTMEPLTNTLIYCKQKNISVQTDEKGYYKISLPVENSPLQFNLMVMKKGYGILSPDGNLGDFYNDAVDNGSGRVIEFFALKKGSFDGKGYLIIAENAKDEEGLNYENIINRLPRIQEEINSKRANTDTVPEVSVTKPLEKDRLSKSSSDFEITEDKAVIKLKDGTVEKYNLKDPAERSAFEKKYGMIVSPESNTTVRPVVVAGTNTSLNAITVTGYPLVKGTIATTVNTNSNIQVKPVTSASVNAVTVTGYPLVKVNAIASTVNTNSNIEVKPVISTATTSVNAITVTGYPLVKGNVVATTITPVTVIGQQIATTDRVVAGREIPSRATVTTNAVSRVKGTTIIAPMQPAVTGERVYIAEDDDNAAIGGKEEVLVTITNHTTRNQLDDFKKQMKEKGIDLEYADIEYNDKGLLINLTGTLDSKDGRSNFVANDFEKLILSMITNGDRKYFKVRVKNKEVI